MKILITAIFVVVAYSPAAAAMLAEVEPLTPLEMVGWSAFWCGLAGGVSAAREWQGWDVVIRTAAYMAVAGPAAMWGSFYWHHESGALSWSVLGLVVFCSLGGYAAVDWIHNQLRRLGTSKVDRVINKKADSD